MISSHVENATLAVQSTTLDSSEIVSRLDRVRVSKARTLYNSFSCGRKLKRTFATTQTLTCFLHSPLVRRPKPSWRHNNNHITSFARTFHSPPFKSFPPFHRPLEAASNSPRSDSSFPERPRRKKQKTPKGCSTESSRSPSRLRRGKSARLLRLRKDPVPALVRSIVHLHHTRKRPPCLILIHSPQTRTRPRQFLHQCRAPTARYLPLPSIIYRTRETPLLDTCHPTCTVKFCPAAKTEKARRIAWI